MQVLVCASDAWIYVSSLYLGDGDQLYIHVTVYHHIEMKWTAWYYVALLKAFLLFSTLLLGNKVVLVLTILPQWGASDTEIKVPSDENTELKCSLFTAWNMSVYSHTCYAYCQGFPPRLFLPFRSIHLHFFPNPPDFFPVLAVVNTGSRVGPQNKIGHQAGCRFPCWVPAEYE